jgi:hypothetical protein
MLEILCIPDSAEASVELVNLAFMGTSVDVRLYRKTNVAPRVYLCSNLYVGNSYHHPKIDLNRFNFWVLNADPHVGGDWCQQWLRPTALATTVHAVL